MKKLLLGITFSATIFTSFAQAKTLRAEKTHFSYFFLLKKVGKQSFVNQNLNHKCLKIPKTPNPKKI